MTEILQLIASISVICMVLLLIKYLIIMVYFFINNKYIDLIVDRLEIVPDKKIDLYVFILSLAYIITYYL